MKYRDYDIKKTGEVYRVTTPTGEKWAEVAVNRATAKRWVDAHIAERRGVDTRKRWGNSGIEGVGVNSPAMMQARKKLSEKTAAPKRETLEQAGYTYVRPLGDGEHLLRDEDGKFEVWFVNDGHASYGLRWNDHDLEFARSAAIPNYGGAR